MNHARNYSWPHHLLHTSYMTPANRSCLINSMNERCGCFTCSSPSWLWNDCAPQATHAWRFCTICSACDSYFVTDHALHCWKCTWHGLYPCKLQNDDLLFRFVQCRRKILDLFATVKPIVFFFRILIPTPFSCCVSFPHPSFWSSKA